MVHDPGSADRPAQYTIYMRDGRKIAEVPSIVDAATVANVPGLPHEQLVMWSPTENTALIYENMSDASPAYRHYLITKQPSSPSMNVSTINLGTRHSSLEDIYGTWPTVARLDDSELELNWVNDPKPERVSIAKLLAHAKNNTEQDGGGNALEPPSHPSTARPKSRATP